MAIGTGAAILGGSLISGAMGKKSADKQGQISQQQYQQTRNDLSPYRNAGVNALNNLNNLNIGELAEQDPGYQFGRDEALGATSRYMGSRGFGNSGNVLAALGDRATGLGHTYANDIWGRQMGLANMGANAATNTGSFGAQNAGNQINASQFGAGSINNAVQGGISNYMLNDYLNQNPYQGATTNSLVGYGQANWASP